MLSASDALFSLHIPVVGDISGNAAVTGVCFVGQSRTGNAHDDDDDDGDEVVLRKNENTDSDEENDDEDDKCESLQFKCSNLLLGRDDYQRNKQSYYDDATRLSAASHTSLSGVALASCHQDGTCKLFDLASRRCIVSDVSNRDGPGLTVRRLSTQQFLYQSRDVLGTVSLHDIHRPSEPILQLHTHSTTFCQMAPCHTESSQYDAANEHFSVTSGERHLIALPTQEQSIAIIRDLRCDPTTNPIFRIDIGNDYYDNMMYQSRRSYGMVTSLALCLQEKARQQLVLGCGMEDGSALFYDLRAKGSPWLSNHVSNETDCNPDEISKYLCSLKLGKDPVLSLDLSRKDAGMFVAVAGCAGDADELSELPEQDQGTVSTINIELANDSTSSSDEANSMKASIRTKTRTCSIESGGKVGVSVCRFRPDGRIFAVGGWDRRLRLFDRASSKPLAILRGHDSTVTAVDWKENASSSGLLATGAGDGRICIYRLFPNTSLRR